MDFLETLLKSLISQAQAKKDAPVWWRWVLGLALVLGLGYVRHQLTAREKALIAARDALEAEREKAAWARLVAQVNGLETRRTDALGEVAAYEAHLSDIERALEANEARHAQALATYKALETADWDALNAQAGVKP